VSPALDLRPILELAAGWAVRKRERERKKSSSHAPKSREKMVETTDDFR